MKKNNASTMTWYDERVDSYELSGGGHIFVQTFRCGACGLRTESYVRFGAPKMPEDADRPRYCPNCGAKATNPGPYREWTI